MKAKYVRIVSPYYCGMKIDRFGQAVDIYKSAYHIFIFDVDELKQKISENRELARKLMEKIKEELKSMETHARLCSTFDCQRFRERWYFELIEDILKTLGVRFEKITVTCEDPPSEIEKLPEVDPIDVLLSFFDDY